MPAGLQPEAYAPRNRFNESYFLAARTKPGVSFEQAQAWMGVLTSRVHNSDGLNATIANNSNWSISIVPMSDVTAGDNKPASASAFGSRRLRVADRMFQHRRTDGCADVGSLSRNGCARRAGGQPGAADAADFV